MFEPIIQQITIMAAIMALGFCLRKGRMIDAAGTSQMSDLVLYVANPVLIAQALMMPFEADKLTDGLICIGITLIMTVILIASTHFIFHSEQAVARFGVIFSNCGMIGIPLVQSVLGQEYVFYLSMCNAVQTFVLWTYGLYIISGDRSTISAKRIVTNPCIIALVIGIVCFVCSFEPAPLLDSLLTNIANLNTGLVMIVLGSYLAATDLRGLIRSRLLYETCGLRLVAVPIVLIALLAFMPIADLKVKITVIITLAAPAASTTAMFSEKYGRDYRLGSGIVALSTLMSLITLPIAIMAGSVIL